VTASGVAMTARWEEFNAPSPVEATKEPHQVCSHIAHLKSPGTFFSHVVS